MREKFVKDESGFSLLEVVFSIGMLAFLSVFILQMFMASAAANRRAKDIDTASYIASGVIEELRACNFANDFFNTDFVVYTQASVGLSDYFVIDEKLGYNAFDFSKGLSLYKYYDNSWEGVELSRIVEEPDNPDVSNIKFMLKLTINPAEEYEASGGGLFRVNVTVFSMNIDSGMRQLVSYDTKAYFAMVGEIYGY